MSFLDVIIIASVRLSLVQKNGEKLDNKCDQKKKNHSKEKLKLKWPAIPKVHCGQES